MEKAASKATQAAADSIKAFQPTALVPIQTELAKIEKGFSGMGNSSQRTQSEIGKIQLQPLEQNMNTLLSVQTNYNAL